MALGRRKKPLIKNNTASYNINSSDNNNMVVIVFNVPKEDAEQLYNVASKNNIRVSSLIRSILYDRTNNLKSFDNLVPDPYPTTKSGRPIKRFQETQ